MDPRMKEKVKNKKFNLLFFVSSPNIQITKENKKKKTRSI